MLQPRLRLLFAVPALAALSLLWFVVDVPSFQSGISPFAAQSDVKDRSYERLLDYTSPASLCLWPEVERHPADVTTEAKGWLGLHSGEGENDTPARLPDMVPALGIERYMRAHLEELQEPYDAQHDLEEYGLKLGNVSLTAYTAELLDTYRRYLSPSPSDKQDTTWLPLVLSRLSLRPPSVPLPPAPKVVMTTEKSIRHIPSEFARWKEIMPDWDIKYFDDAALEKWVSKHFGHTLGEKIWRELPRVVLKTDTFRYLAMLVEGGIYTDSDTAPIIHVDQWGRPYEHYTPPLLTHLSRLLSITTTPHLPADNPLSSFSSEHSPTEWETGDQSTIYNGPIVDDGAELGEPALIISVESDAIDFGWYNWRDIGLSRAVQITQWTFLARPGHPVFLDALGRIFRKSEQFARLEAEAKARGETLIPETALEWSGPGVFSDAVYRYLLARYGFRPEELIHVKSPIRVGDVLILPAGSFSSIAPWSDEPQRDWAATYHGFKGRWRESDPGMVEFERLKKIKEEAAAEALKHKAAQDAGQEKKVAEDGPEEDILDARR